LVVGCLQREYGFLEMVGVNSDKRGSSKPGLSKFGLTMGSLSGIYMGHHNAYHNDWLERGRSED
jgi:hypothetical protein